MSFREEVKKCRKEHNLSQEELAKNMSVSVKDIEKWENALALPSEENIDALANYFGKPKENFTPTVEEEELVQKRVKARKKIRIFQIVGYCLLLSFLGICLFLVILHSKKSYLFESDRVLLIDDYYVFVEEKVFVNIRDLIKLVKEREHKKIFLTAQKEIKDKDNLPMKHTKTKLSMKSVTKNLNFEESKKNHLNTINSSNIRKNNLDIISESGQNNIVRNNSAITKQKTEYKFPNKRFMTKEQKTKQNFI